MNSFTNLFVQFTIQWLTYVTHVLVNDPCCYLNEISSAKVSSVGQVIKRSVPDWQKPESKYRSFRQLTVEHLIFAHSPSRRFFESYRVNLVEPLPNRCKFLRSLATFLWPKIAYCLTRTSKYVLERVTSYPLKSPVESEMSAAVQDARGQQRQQLFIFRPWRGKTSQIEFWFDVQSIH